MIKIGIAGATGYVGIELMRILANYSDAEIVYLASNTHHGLAITEVYPHIRSSAKLKCLDPFAMAKECDLVFSALPAGHSTELAKAVVDAGKKMIDLGADFRLKNPTDYKQWYGHASPPGELLQQAVYGLPEITPHAKIQQASLIANPGCYPTCIALGAYPALSSGIIDIQRMIFDAKSGISGAGRTLALKSHFCEASENFKAYDIAGSHRHVPEIEQILCGIAGSPVTIQFTPHLLPMNRGLLVTSYLSLKHDVSTKDIWEIYSSAYQDKPFIKLYAEGLLPQTADVKGSNACHIGFKIDPRTNNLIVVSVIDNLVKGAAGQAIQNMNIMFDQPETKGLHHLCPIYP
jgi:N-acetyl-gamma-glutamyl-phosphate reductase